MDAEPTYFKAVPRPGEVPPGLVVVHNHVRPTRRLGSRGFRAWLAAPAARFVPCDCGWAPELGSHYSVDRGNVIDGSKCVVNEFSSRVCEMGTKACNVRHIDGVPMPEDRMMQGVWPKKVGEDTFDMDLCGVVIGQERFIGAGLFILCRNERPCPDHPEQFDGRDNG